MEPTYAIMVGGPVDGREVWCELNSVAYAQYKPLGVHVIESGCEYTTHVYDKRLNHRLVDGEPWPYDWVQQ